MSTEQQDAVLGRIIREYGECKKTLVVLYSEAERMGNYLTAIGHALRKNHSLEAGTFGDQLGIVDLGQLPTQVRVQQLVDQISELELTKRQLSGRLRDAGYEPKD